MRGSDIHVDGKRVNPDEGSGTIKIPAHWFPRETLAKIMDGGAVPMVAITIPKAYLAEGLSLNSENGTVDLEFVFITYEMEIKEA